MKLNPSQQMVADALGVLDSLARGMRGAVQPATYEAFADVLGLTVKQLKANIRQRRKSALEKMRKPWSKQERGASRSSTRSPENARARPST